MYSSNYMLSQMNIDYSDCMNQPAIDQRLQDVLSIMAAVKAGTYATPNYSPAPPDSVAAFDPLTEARESAAQIACQAAINTGNLQQTHAAVDAYNAIRATMGLGPFNPPSDLDILAHSHQSVGTLLQKLQGMTPVPDVLANPAKFDALIAQSNASTPPPQAPAVPVVALDSSSAAMLPVGFAVTDANGNKWIVLKTPFGSILALASALNQFGLQS